MENTMNVQINSQDAHIRNLKDRFFKLMEAAEAAETRELENVVSLDRFKKDMNKDRNDEAERILDAMSINAFGSMLDIIQIKVQIVTGEQIFEEESRISVDEVYKVFSDSIEHAENVYTEQGQDIYDMPLFTISDAFTTIAASRIVETFYQSMMPKSDDNSDGE